MTGCACSWPDDLDPECAVHGRIEHCACGRPHSTMPALDLGDGLKLPAVCRIHKAHRPCRGCARAAERLAEQVLEH